MVRSYKSPDGIDIFFQDWGEPTAHPVILSHGWPLHSESWDVQAFHLASNGFRVIAHDRRGHGRSMPSWHGNDMDHYADDLAGLIEHLGLLHVSIIGFSAGGGEVARYVGRHGTANVARLGLISSVTPFLLKTDDNPDGAPLEVFDAMRQSQIADRARYFRELADGPFYGFNRPQADVSRGQADRSWDQGMMASLKATYDSVAAFCEDFRSDLAKFDRPTLVVHGDDDQIVPIGLSAHVVTRMLPAAQVKIYEGAPHGLNVTHAARLNEDLLDFLRS